MSVPELSVHDFLAHPQLSVLAVQPRWCVSDRNKRPVDIMAATGVSPVIRGLSFHDLGSRGLTLGSVVDRLPDPAANYTFYLQADVDDLVVVDIEPGCDPELRAELLELPFYYAEVSSSGEGLHLLVDLPKNYRPEVTPVSLKHPSGGFEVLFQHWVIFTGNPYHPKPSNLEGSGSVEDVYDQLLADRVSGGVGGVAAADLVEVDGLVSDEVLFEWGWLVDQLGSLVPGKVLSDFPDPVREGDHSRYEYYLLGFFLRHARRLQFNRLTGDQAAQRDPSRYAPAEVEVLVIAEALRRFVPFRVKHGQFRRGLPYLVAQAQSLVSSSPLDVASLRPSGVSGPVPTGVYSLSKHS